MERTILHVDMNGFFASVECLHHPALREQPVAVGGDAEARHGIILAKNEPAKRSGVKTGEALWQARQKCPGLVILPPHYEQYFRFARMAREIYAEYTPQVEAFGIDEAWLDVTDTPALRRHGGEALAHILRERVKAELGLTVSVGLSFNKVFAKLGSDYKKPDAVTVFSRENMRELIWPLPAGDLLYVGRAMERKLRGYGVRTIGQLAETPPKTLQSWFGKWGLVLSAFANGMDTTPVAAEGAEEVVKSIGNSTTTPRDLVCDGDASVIFWMLAESVAERMREGGFLCRTVQISLRTGDLRWWERQMKLETPTCLASELHRAAMTLLRAGRAELGGDGGAWERPLRSIGLRGTELLPAGTPVQLSLFEDAEKRARLERLERTVDALRRRFGHDSVSRASAVSDRTLRNIDAKREHAVHPVGFFKAV